MYRVLLNDVMRKIPVSIIVPVLRQIIQVICIVRIFVFILLITVNYFALQLYLCHVVLSLTPLNSYNLLPTSKISAIATYPGVQKTGH